MRCAVVIALCLAFSGVASAATPVRGLTTVACGSGGDLQAAIDAAAPGATIDVSGTCHGHFGIIGKDLTIQGSPSATLDGSNGSGGARSGTTARRR